MDWGLDWSEKKRLEKLPNIFGSMDKLHQATYEALLKIPSIGHKIAQSVVDFCDPLNGFLIDALTDLYFNMVQEPVEGEGSLQGLTFVVTGRLTIGSRKGIEDLLRGLGAQVSGSVSSKTDYLVAGEKSGSKLEQSKGFRH